MKYIVASFVIALTLTGCGDSDKFLEEDISKNKDNTKQELKEESIESPVQEVEQPEQEKEKISQKQYIPDQILPSKDRSFSSIKKLIEASGNGIIGNVTYICVGDSTRANSHYGGVYVFTDIRDRLDDYNVVSYLHARAGHKAEEFNRDYGASPTWKDVVSDISDDGKNTIVDISLGINDSWGGDGSFKYYLKSAINKIKNYKPNTHFILTMPDRVYGNSIMTNEIKQQYQELSYELHLPLVNIVEDVMPSQDSTSYNWYRHDGFNVHLSREGQRRVANDILSHILPD